VGDTEALAREMVRVAASVEIRSSMAAAAVQATRPFTHCISDHERLYDSVRRHDPRSNRQGRDG
jgi:hypothetical protein